MKSKLILIGLLAAVVPTAAVVIPTDASAQAFYYKLNYRDNDPFLFCEQGQNVKAPCWRPLPPYTGNFRMMAYCKPPTYPYGKDWTNDDWQSLGEYLMTCPMAEKSGKWDSQKSNGRQKDMVPHKH